MATTIIENLVTKFGFDVDQSKLDKIDVGIKNVVKGLTAVAAVAVAAGTAIFIFTKSIAASNDELGKLAETLGVDVESLRELGFAAELNGGSVESMNSSLSSLTKTMAAAAMGVGGGIEAFGRLGLSITDAQGEMKKTDEFLFEIADAFAALGTQAEKLDLAGKMGIDASLIITLDKGSAALKSYREEFKQLNTTIDAAAAASFNDALLKTQTIFSGLSNIIGEELMKEITPLLDAFVKWFKLNKDLISQNVLGFVKGLVSVFRFLADGVNIIITIINTLIKIVKVIIKFINDFKYAIIGFGIGIALANAQLLLLKGSLLLVNIQILAVNGALLLIKGAMWAVRTASLAMQGSFFIIPILIGLIVAVIALLIEDIITFFKGGESVVGEFLKKFPELEKVVESVVKNIKAFFEDPFGNLKIALKNITNYFVEVWDTAVNKVIAIWDKLTGLIPSFDLETFTNLIDKAKSLFGFGETSFTSNDAVKNPITIPTNNTSNSSSKTKVEDNRTISITVNGGNPEEVKRIFHEQLNNTFIQANNNVETPVEG